MRLLFSSFAILLAGCSIITSLDGYTFEDVDAGEDAGTVRDAGPGDAGAVDAGPCGVCEAARPFCDIESSACVQCLDDGACDDRDPCTLDRCSLGTCDYTSVSCVRELSLGRDYSCANRGRVYCWGANASGQLGDGTRTSRATPAVVSTLFVATGLSAGHEHACAITSGGNVSCWGLNDWGQLGDGTIMTRDVPVTISGLSAVTRVSAGVGGSDEGEAHTCALVDAGEVVCWGDNRYGQLGDGSQTNRLMPTPVPGITDAVQVVAGGGHTCALLMGGAVRCWGDNALGQLGNGTNTRTSEPVAVVGLADAEELVATSGGTCARRVGGTVTCWGSRHPAAAINTPEPVAGLTEVIALGAGMGHFCALRSSGTIACWGDNTFGQLGDGTTTHSASPLVVDGLTDADLLPRQLGFHSCARRVTGDVACWGNNTFGQLGDGTMNPSLTPVVVVGL